MLVPALAAGALLAAGGVRTVMELRERHENKRKFIAAFHYYVGRTVGQMFGWQEATDADRNAQTPAGDVPRKESRQTALFIVNEGDFTCYAFAELSMSGEAAHFQVDGPIDVLHALKRALDGSARYLHMHIREAAYTTLLFDVQPDFQNKDLAAPLLFTEATAEPDKHG